MMFTKELIMPPEGSKARPKEELNLNIDYWKDAEKPLNIIFDEAQTIMNARRSFSAQSVKTMDFISLLRRVLGSVGSEYGDMTIISQLSRRIDVIVREQTNKVYYFTCLYKKRCHKCGFNWNENSDMPEQLSECPMCGHYKIEKYNHILDIRVFASCDEFDLWKHEGMVTFYKRFLCKDIENAFGKYDSLQWDSMFS
jgi:predicted Zn-ribbon and HTH transcriptional regulator